MLLTEEPQFFVNYITSSYLYFLYYLYIAPLQSHILTFYISKDVAEKGICLANIGMAHKKATFFEHALSHWSFPTSSKLIRMGYKIHSISIKFHSANFLVLLLVLRLVAIIVGFTGTLSTNFMF